MATIKDGETGKVASVNSQNQLETHAVTHTSSDFEIEKGLGWNLNTGDIVITGDATLMYFKNTSDNPFVIEALALGLSGGISWSATPNDTPFITLVKSPTGGDLITDATPIEMNQNRNFGFTDSVGGDVFKGKVGGTITGGNGDVAKLIIGKTGRTFFSLGWIIPKQASIAITLTLNGTGTANLYTAIIGHFDDL